MTCEHMGVTRSAAETKMDVLLTHKDPDKMEALVQMTFPNAFSWKETFN